MSTLDGEAAIAWMRAKGSNIPGACLNTIWQAYGSHPSTGPHAGQYPNAIDGWNYATRRHAGDPTPPAGYPVYFDALPRPRYAGDDNYPCGDIVLSLGGGNVICTDGAGAGRIAVMTIAQRARQIGRTYLGWTEDFLGYDVVTPTTASLGNATPISQGEEDMPKYQIVNAAGSQSLIFTGPGVAFPLPNMIWHDVMQAWAAATNANEAPNLLDAQWQIVTAVLDGAPVDQDKLAGAIADHVLAALSKPGTAAVPLTKQDVIDALHTLTLTAQ